MAPTNDSVADKRDLLAMLLAEEGIDEPEDKPGIARRERPEHVPCSFSQELLWLLHELMPETTAYNVRWAMRISGDLDRAALQRSLDAILERHEVLRTTFASKGGEPVQVISEDTTLKVDPLDLRAHPKDAQEAEVHKLLRRNAERPWSFAKDRIRGTLVQLEDKEHVLLLELHHIYCDGWSRGVFFKELSALYEHFTTGRPHGLPELPIQYADFAMWQREWRESADYQRQIDYWKKQLQGAPALLELPTDRPRPPVQTYKGSRESVRLPKELVDKLRALAQSLDATLFMTLLAAFKALLFRYTGQDDVVVGSPIANRNHVEVERLIGFFVNAVILRTQIAPETTFKELVRRVRDASLSAYENQDVPYEKLVIELKPERDLSYTPLFQVMFILQNVPKESRELTGLTISTVEMGHETAKFDLTLSCTEIGAEINAIVGYNVGLFDATTIQRFLGHFKTLLESVVQNPDWAVGKVPILPEAEKRTILVDWNATDRSYERGLRAHDLFARRAAANPGALAVVADDGRLTYGDLDERSNRLARHLQELGVGPDVLVGVSMEKSTSLVVALLAVLKAGGAYVPMDPAYPKDRLEHLLADTQAGVLLTQIAVLPNLPETKAKRVLVDADWAEIQKRDAGPVTSRATPESLVYAIFTSGSTGKSKGVLVEHRNLVNQYFAWEESYRLTELKSHLQMASVSFDVFSGDFVRALGSGGALVLASRDKLLDPPSLYELMVRERVECAEFVPAVLRALVQHLEDKGGDLSFMTLLVAGSDVWQIQEYISFRRFLAPGARLVSSFGLTETTIDTTFFEDPRLAPDTPGVELEGTVPIGKPFGNSRVYLLDANGAPVPIGVRGEIFIGGEGVTRGYLNRPELTAERFVPDPFSTTGGRLYKTGDVGRYKLDGNIEFLGRTDNQVKLRGYRIELGEIETVLGEHAGVAGAVVMVREDVPGNKRLVGYVVPKEGHRALDHAELKAFVKAKLPEYMVPSTFLELERFPLSPNGKVDRRALPAPEPGDDTTAFVAPRTPVEEMVADIWKGLLKAPRVGVHDNFFELGGHSLLATQVISRVRDAFEVDLGLRSLFEAPTVEGMALAIVKKLAEEAGDEDDGGGEAAQPDF